MKEYRNPLCLYAFIVTPVLQLSTFALLLSLEMKYRTNPSSLTVILVLVSILFLPVILLYLTPLSARDIGISTESISTMHPGRRGALFREYPNKGFTSIHKFLFLAYASGEKSLLLPRYLKHKDERFEIKLENGKLSY